MKGDSSRVGMERNFNDWHAEVIAKCPKDKLLVFDVREGWAPLCKFLGKPIPDVPFPNTNDTQAMQELHKKVNRQGWLYLGLTLGAVGSGFAYWFNQKK